MARRIGRSPVLAACIGLAAFGLAADASAGAYTFTTLASTSGEFSGFGNPAINASGTVAFIAARDNGTAGVFRTAGGATTTIADTAGIFSFVQTSQLVSINAAGTVAFFAGLDNGDGGVFTGSGGPTTPIALALGGPFDGSFGSRSPTLNDAGTVAFRARLDDGSQGLFTGNGGPPHDRLSPERAIRPVQ